MEKTIQFQFACIRNMDVLDATALNCLKGGETENEDEYEIIYINGVPYRVKKNSAGQIIEMQPL